MIPSTTVTRSGPHTGNGVARSWTFQFKLFTSSDFAGYAIRIIKTDAGGIESELTSNYQLTPHQDQDRNPGGIFVYPVSGTPLSANETITIVSNVDFTQLTEFLRGGAFNAKVVEERLDWLTMLIRQVAETTQRSLRFPISTASGRSTEIPTGTNQFLALDASGNLTATQKMGTFRDAWVSGQSYAMGDMVRATTSAFTAIPSIFRCNTRHTATGTEPLDTNTHAGYWDILISAEQLTGVFNSNNNLSNYYTRAELAALSSPDEVDGVNDKVMMLDASDPDNPMKWVSITRAALQGPAGATGPTGAAGAAGAQGMPGMLGGPTSWTTTTLYRGTYVSPPMGEGWYKCIFPGEQLYYYTPGNGPRTQGRGLYIGNPNGVLVLYWDHGDYRILNPFVNGFNIRCTRLGG